MDLSFEVILKALVKDKNLRGDLDLTKFFIEGTFVIAKRGKGARYTKCSVTILEMTSKQNGKYFIFLVWQRNHLESLSTSYRVDYKPRT